MDVLLREDVCERLRHSRVALRSVMGAAQDLVAFLVETVVEDAHRVAARRFRERLPELLIIHVCAGEDRDLRDGAGWTARASERIDRDLPRLKPRVAAG